MDFHSMKRRELQSLCKKHSIPANLTNREMANRLTSIFKEKEQCISQGESSVNNPIDIASENDSMVMIKKVKKVRFSPENETFIFPNSGTDSDKEYTPAKKRRGKRKSMVKPVSKKQMQVIENGGSIGLSAKNVATPVRTRSQAQKVVEGDVNIVLSPPVGKKRARRGTKLVVELRDDVEVGNGNGKVSQELGRRQLRSREVVVEKTREEGVADLGVSRKNVTRRGSKKRVNAKGNDGLVLLDESSEKDISADINAKPERITKRSKQTLTKGKDSAALSEEVGKTIYVGRNTRSRTQLKGNASAVESEGISVVVQEESEKVLQLKEPSMGLARNALRRKSVVPQEGRVENEILDGKGAEPGMVLRKSKRNVAKGKDSEQTRSITAILNSTVPDDGELGTYGTVGRAEQLTEPCPGKDAIVTEKPPRLSRRNASRQNSTVSSNESDEIAVVVEKSGKLKRRQEPILNEETHVSEFESLIEKPMRRSTRITSKGDLVAAAELTGKAVEMKQSDRSKIPVIIEKSPLTVSPEELQIEDDGLAVPEAAGNNNNSDSNCSKEVFESSKRKRKKTRGKSSAKKQLSSVKVSTVFSHIEEIINNTESLVEIPVPSPVKFLGVSTSQETLNFATESVVVNEKDSNLVVDEKGKSQMDDVVEGEMEEQSPWFLNKKGDIDDCNLIEPEQVQNDVVASEITSPADEFSPPNQLYHAGEPSNLLDLEKGLETEEPSTSRGINPRSDNLVGHSTKDDKTSVQEDQNFVRSEDAHRNSEKVIQEVVIEVHLDGLNESTCPERNPENSSEKAEELSAIDPSNGEGAAQAETLVEASEMQIVTSESNLGSVESDAERIAELQLSSSGHHASLLSPFKHSPESQERNQPEAQHIANSTMLGRSCTNRVGECFSPETEILDETTSRAETSVSSASGGMCTLEKIEDDKTVEYEHEEACCFERASAAAVDEIIYEGLEVCDLPAFIKTDGPGVEDKENLTSQGNSEGNSEETREKCMHELSVGDGIHSATLEEKGIDSANFVLQSPSTVDKGMFSLEHPLLKDNDDYEQASGIANKNLSCCRVNLSMDNNIKEQEVNQLKYQVSSSVKGRNLIEALLNESTNSIEKAAVDEKVKANYSNREASSKDLAGDKSMKGESVVEQCDLIKEADHIVCEEVPAQVIGVADTSLTEAICKSSGISEESVEMAINSAECIERINMLEKEESKTENKSFDANEAKFRDLDDHKEEKISEHEKKATIASDNTMSVDGIDDDRKAHDGKVDSDLNWNDYSSDAGMEHNIDAIPQVTSNDIGDDSVEEEILGVNGSDCNGILNHSRADIRAAADEAGLVTMDGKISSRDIENDTNQVEIAPTSPQICRSGRKWEEKNTAEGKLFDDTSFGKTEIGSGDKCEFQVHSDVNSNEAEGKDMSYEDRGNDPIDTDLPFQEVDEVAMGKRVGTVKGNEDLIDAKKGFNEENIARTSEKVSKEQLDHGGALKDAGSHKLDDKVVTGDDSKDFLDFENLFVLSSSKPEMGVECSPLSPVIAYSDHENTASEFHVESPMLTTWEMNLILGGERDEVEKSDGGALESNLLSQEFEDAMEVKEHVTIIEQEDQLVAEKQPDEQEHHAHLAVSDEPICDGGEGTNEKDDVSAINKEYIDHENHEDESVEAHISTHKVMLTDDVIVSGRNYAASDKPLAECGHRDLEQEEYIANPGVQDIFGNSTHPRLLTGGKREEENSEEIKLFADSSHGRPEIGSSSAAVSWLNVPASYEEEYNPCTYRMEVSNEARGKETTGEDKGTDPTDMNSLFQEDDKVTMEKSVGPQKDYEALCDATDGSNVENNVTDSQEAAKEQLDGCRDVFHEAIVMDGTDFLSLNTPVCGDECKSHVAEAESENSLHKLDRKVDTLEVANIDVVSSLKPEVVVDCSVGNVPTDMVSLFQEDDEATIGERVGALNDDEGLDDATDGFSVENNVIDSQEAAKKQLDGHKDVTHEAIDFLASNQSLYGGESKSHLAETEETHSLHKLDDKVVTAGDTIEVAEFENLDRVSSLKPGMVVDCSAVSPVSASSYHIYHENKGLEYHVESHIFTTLEMNLFSSSGDQDDALESGSGAPETSMTNEDAGETEENAMIVEQVAEEQLSEHKQQMAEEFAEANKEAGEDSNNQDDIYAIIQGSFDCKNHRDEPVKVESSQVSSEDMKMTEVAEINGNHPFASYKATSGCDSNDLEGDNIANSGIDDLKFSVERNKSEDIGEAMELSKDLTKLYAKIVDQSPVFTNSAIGKDIVAEDFQRVSPQKKSPDGNKEESSSFFAKQLSSSIMKRKNNKAILIQRTPKRYLAHDMKENGPSTKSEQVGNMTAPPALSKRRALEDLRKN